MLIIFTHYWKNLKKYDIIKEKEKGEIKLNGTLERTKEKVVIIPTALGDKRIKIEELNFIDIEQRSLCYHLIAGAMPAAHILRTSFGKAIEPYLVHKNLMFIHPSLLFNLDNIALLNKDHMVFGNGEILYFPRKYYGEIFNRWIE